MSDDDDICGAKCGDGTPCQNPDGSCQIPSHSDPEAENPQGRPFAISEDDHDDILEAAREGVSRSGCARAAGVERQSLDRYLEAHEKFRTDFMRARAVGEKKLVRDGLGDDEVDSSMAKFLLSTSFDYVKTERTEVTGEDGGPIETEQQVQVYLPDNERVDHDDRD